MLQRLTVVTLILGAHISLCAGSLLSVGLAFASQIATDRQSVSMTPDTHMPLCMLATPTADANDTTSDSPCGGKKCSSAPFALSLSPAQGDVQHTPLTFLPTQLYDLRPLALGFERRLGNPSPPGNYGGLLIASVVRHE